MLRLTTCLAAVAIASAATAAEARQERVTREPESASSAPAESAKPLRFLGGAAIAFGLHEMAHVAADLSAGATPQVKRVEFHGIPFFAITPEGNLSRRQQFVIASAGFWAQHAGNEWILSREPRLRERSAPVRKGMLAFNVLASVAYAGAAFARTGPIERDTLGMAEGARMDERVLGTFLLVPAVLDTVRYYKPGAKWAVWVSRGAKIGLVLLVVRSGGS
jgi:hypothetical protein